jgi:phage regulator Rha-like protein
MSNLVIIEKNDLLTTSLVIAEGVKYEHRTVLKLIREHETSIKEFGIITLGVRKSTRGKPTEFYNLNEPQVYFLLTLMKNNEQVTKFKINLVKEFMKMRKALMNLQVMHQDKQWQQSRLSGKAIRREETDVIKSFVEYAVMQGSTNAVRYYANITNMENKALFIMEQKFPNVREVLNHQQLSTLKVADKMVMDTLQEGMECDMHYKEIYKLAKERVEQLASLVKPTIVISATEVKLIE